MLFAQQCKRKALNAIRIRIRQRANAGEFSLQFIASLPNDIVKELKKDGFKVKIFKTGTVNISWEDVSLNDVL